MFRRALGEVRIKRPLTLRLYNRFLHKYLLRDLGFALQLEAQREAVAYIRRNMPDAAMCADRWQLLRAAVDEAPAGGLFLEFGVEKGASANFIARRLAARSGLGPLHAFDSFEGLPEDWSGTVERRGKFSQRGRVPELLPNVTVHKGWFSETLPRFCAELSAPPVSLVHIDCDIYASTRTVFEHVGGRLARGTIVVFDEYLNYHGWSAHEYKAWQECVEQRGIRYTYRGFSAQGGQVYLRIDAVGQRVARLERA
jgi:predicted O-methyltransferase YrrM